MRISFALFSVLLLLVSAKLSQPRAIIHEVNAVRIPEHTCHKLVDMNSCDLQKCNQECSKEPLGVGECRNAFCSCTYYCKQPPM
ncbi:hypothetical protein SADUNF_Sadunf16G0055300 [Salix dunnii]|uniref:Uncharacterized protein n=1 Tax=Salix dunnii TaxID=1413687 RepID=A0A835J8K9_9ROSI|nr:hypothetical protein SADUNF_Sadunf16G0055300 [Salix dunnii]